MAQAIVDAHRATLALPLQPGAVAPAPAADDPVFVAALQACHELGFIDADALSVARAWSHRSRHTGQFDPALWPTDPADFDIAPYPRDHAYARVPRPIGLYAVMPDAAWTIRMARAGVPTVQLRFKSTDAAAIDREVAAAIGAVRGTGALLFVNDHWQAASAAGAYGVHLGQEDLDALTPDALQRLRASGMRLGVSTHGYAEMVRADAVSPSYIAMGAVFPTTLKKMATAPQGIARLGAYARLLRGYPQVAIGGIDAERLPAVLATGVGSVAVVRALITAEDPASTAAQWIRAVADCTPTSLSAR